MSLMCDASLFALLGLEDLNETSQAATVHWLELGRDRLGKEVWTTRLLPIHL